MKKSILKVDPVAYRYDDDEFDGDSDDFSEEDDFEWDHDDLGEGIPDEDLLDEDFDEDEDDDEDEDFDDDDIDEDLL